MSLVLQTRLLSKPLLAASLCLLCALPALARSTSDSPAVRSAAEIIAAAPDSDWRTIAPENLLIMTLADGVVYIELAPRFAPQHVDNIRALAQAQWWDGLSIYRAQDNFVVQFGDSNSDDETRKKPLPATVRNLIAAEFSRPDSGLQFDALPDVDGWAEQTGFVDGFAAARDNVQQHTWLTHCYGTVGAGRGNAPDSSLGAELYVVIGHAPRQLDRNITVVGRVIKGMQHLSRLTRSDAPLGMYTDASAHTPIQSIRLASQLPEAARPQLQALRTNSRSFIDATEARRNRRDAWYVRPAGHIDICNVPLPIREKPTPSAH